MRGVLRVSGMVIIILDVIIASEFFLLLAVGGIEVPTSTAGRVLFGAAILAYAVVHVALWPWKPTRPRTRHRELVEK